MIAPPALVLIEQNVDVVFFDVSARRGTRFCQCLAHSLAQLLINPLFDGNAEAHLGAIQDLSGNKIAHSAFEDGIEAHGLNGVASPHAMWKPSSQGLHYMLAEASRQSCKAASSPIKSVPSVTSEHLVAAIAGEDDLDVLAREFRDHVGRNRGRIC